MADHFSFSDWGRKPWARPIEYYAGSRSFRNRRAAIRYAEVLSNRNQVETEVYWTSERGGQLSELGHTTRKNGAGLKKNPTKVQKREKVRKASVQRRVASALAKFLHQANPAMKPAGA